MEKIIEAQREYFNSNITKSYKFRKNALLTLKNEILKNYDELIKAFKEDYNKCEFDVVSTEIGMVMQELRFMLKNLKRLMKPKRAGAGLLNMCGKGYIYPEPYGVTLIVAPWNYPFHLSMIPLIDAIATGNTVVIKPSRNTPNVSAVIEKILSVFDKNYIYVTYKDESERDVLFDQKFDFVFYTGSPQVAKDLMKRQAKFLTPVVLELGGKSPLIVDSDADLKMAAKRIVWGKYLNAGQTCIAPDYLMVQKSVKEKLLPLLKEYIQKYFYQDGKLTENFPWLVAKKSISHIKECLEESEVYVGGEIEERLMHPTILNNVKTSDKIMGNEIFAPILPVIEYENIEEVISYIKKNEKPLALYYFGKANRERVFKECSFGGGCSNECIMHITSESMPFGGVGNSGMGSYHGKKSFETFSHYKSILKKGKVELPLKYPPYTKSKLSIVKWFFGIK